MLREIIPEIDDQAYWDIVSKLESSVPSEEAVFDLLPARAPSATASEPLEMSAEHHMFRAVISSLTQPTSTELVDALTRSCGSAEISFGPGLIAELRDQFTTQLAEFYLRPLVADIRRASGSGELTDSTPEARYRQYCQHWLSRHSHDFYQNYPVLERIHGLLAQQFLDNIKRILERVRLHRAELSSLLGCPRGLLRLERMFLQGDRHGGGQTTCILHFAEGKVVYKPRSVDGEMAYHRIDQWLADRQASSGAAASVIAGEGYGFMEFVESEKVDLESISFLEKTGEMAAVLHSLQANDLHFENVLSRGGVPVPIDLETIMHPVDIISEDAPVSALEGNAYQSLAMGVGASGLLPSKVHRRDPSEGYLDIGFLQGESTGNPFPGLKVERPYRDDAHIVLTKAAAVAPVEGDAEALRREKSRTAQAVANGFARRYRWLLQHRQEYLQAVTSLTKNLRLRAVLQPTLRYAQLLRMLGSPEAMASWEVFRAVSLRTTVFGQGRPFPLADAEATALRRVDIPYFTTMSSKNSVLDSTGRKVGLTLKNPPLKMVRAKISHMSEQNLQEQLVQIWASFVSAHPADQLPPAGHQSMKGLAPNQASAQRALCNQLADHLTATSRPGTLGREPWSWVAPVPGALTHNSSWATKVLAPDLYSGSLGPALALAKAAEISGREQYRNAARNVLDPEVHQILDTAEGILPGRVEDGNSSAFLGDAGLAYILDRAGAHLDIPHYREAALNLGDRTLRRLVATEQVNPDFLTGELGAVAILLGHGIATDTAPGLHVIESHVHDILNGTVPQEWWSQSGFGHGIAASMFTVSRFFDSLGNQQLTEDALQVLHHRLEDFYDNHSQTWLSRSDGSGRLRPAWCHGTAGIAMALAAGQRFVPDIKTNSDRLNTAIEHSLAHGLGRNLTLCHGDLGTLEILRWTAETTERTWLKDTVQKRVDNEYSPERLLQVLEDRSSRYTLTPSFMVGTSGVLYWLCHQIDEESMRLPIIPDSPEVS